MVQVTVEVLSGMYLAESPDGGAPDTLVEVRLIYNGDASRGASPAAAQGSASSVVKETSLCYRSRAPQWGERFLFRGCPTKTPIVGLRLLERAADLTHPPRVLGEHLLSIGGMHRRRGCAWAALKAGCLEAECPTPIMDTPCLRVLWNVEDDMDDQSGADANHPGPAMRSALVMSVRPAPTGAAAVNTSNQPSTPPVAEAVTTRDNDAWETRVQRLEERVDHLDSLFRTRRDYEAEVQRIMLEAASKRAAQEAAETATTSTSNRTALLLSPGMATTPSAAVALLNSHKQKDLVQTCQPTILSVAATTSPWNMFQKSGGSVASGATHFPLRTAAASTSSGGAAHVSALQSILLDPTKVSNVDLELLGTATFLPVALPTPRLIGFTPAPFQPPMNPLRPALTAVAAPPTVAA